MFKSLLTMFFVVCLSGIKGSLYHERSRTTFVPNVQRMQTQYFGYSVVLRSMKPNKLIVGAPISQTKSSKGGGAIYFCGLEELPTTASNRTCSNIKVSYPGRYMSNQVDPFEDEMWLGATMAVTHLGSLVVCAPRWANEFHPNHKLANGICYVVDTNTNTTKERLADLINLGQQAFMIDSSRPEFGQRSDHVNYFAYGQLGFSVAMTPNENAMLLGAPGVLQWAGSVSEYQIMNRVGEDFLIHRRTPNPYYTNEIPIDSYFGYSLEAGTFVPGNKVYWVAGAPRALNYYGMVLIFEIRNDRESLRVHKVLQGQQYGEYFGGSLCALDLNSDGSADLLVSAPNHAEQNSDLYDQGAVYVFLTKPTEAGFEMDLIVKLTGSSKTGARFGSAIAQLGDIDGDGYPDIAIGAPFEGNGAVYIYRGSEMGINPKYSQRISSDTLDFGVGFGISISKGVDVDENGCNDLAVGVFKSDKVQLFRCTPTLHIQASINVIGSQDLAFNATNFTAMFCVNVEKNLKSPLAKLDLSASALVDRSGSRAYITEDSEFRIQAESANSYCKELTIMINANADLSRPIPLRFVLTPTWEPFNQSEFCSSCARISENSKLIAEAYVQLTRDCSDDLICTPDLHLNVTPITGLTFIPGSKDKLGVLVEVTNLAEPAYGACVVIALPSNLVRVPGQGCSLENKTLTCDLPQPLLRNHRHSLMVELDYDHITNEEKDLLIGVHLHERCDDKQRATNEETLSIRVIPQAHLNASGESLPNRTLTITRAQLSEKSNITIAHLYKVQNSGPSDWITEMNIDLPKEKVSNFEFSKVCSLQDDNETIYCKKPLSTNNNIMVAIVVLRYDLSVYEDELKEKQSINISTVAFVMHANLKVEIITTLVLEPAAPWWPIAVGVLAGILVLSTIVFIMYKMKFFNRRAAEDLKKLMQANEDEQQAGQSRPAHDILEEDSDPEPYFDL